MSDSFDDVIGYIEAGSLGVVADDEPHLDLYWNGKGVVDNITFGKGIDGWLAIRSKGDG